MRYLIIGLGIYGTNLAKDLTDMGNEVIGADINATIVAAIKDYISTAYIIDSTDENAIGALPLKSVDLVIVAIGEQFGASIKTVALLRKLGVRKIYARAIDDLHSAILEGMHVERILNPEQSAARDLSDEMALGTHVDSLRVDRDTYVMRFAAPDYFKGMAYIDLTQEAMFGLRLVAASRPRKSTNILGLDSTQLQPVDISNPSAECVQEGDVLTCVGSMKAYKSLGEHIGPS
mgnify:FL=1